MLSLSALRRLVKAFILAAVPGTCAHTEGSAGVQACQTQKCTACKCNRGLTAGAQPARWADQASRLGTGALLNSPTCSGTSIVRYVSLGRQCPVSEVAKPAPERQQPPTPHAQQPSERCFQHRSTSIACRNVDR